MLFSAENKGWVWWFILSLKLNKTSLSIFLESGRREPNRKPFLHLLTKTDPAGLPFSHIRLIYTMTSSMAIYETNLYSEYLHVHIWGQFTWWLPLCPYMRPIHNDYLHVHIWNPFTVTTSMSTYETNSHSDFFYVHIWNQFTKSISMSTYEMIHTMTSSLSTYETNSHNDFLPVHMRPIHKLL